jgi:hypothetical protein
MMTILMEKQIPIKARLIQMNRELEYHYRLEIQDLQYKCFIKI